MQDSLVGNPVQGSPLVRISELHLNSENSEKAKMRPWVLSGQGWSSSSLSCILILMIISRSICHMCPLVLSGQGWFFSSMWNRILVVSQKRGQRRIRENKQNRHFFDCLCWLTETAQHVLVVGHFFHHCCHVGYHKVYLHKIMNDQN